VAKTFELGLTVICHSIQEAGAEPPVATYPDLRPAISAAGGVVAASWRQFFARMREVNEIIRDVAGRLDVFLLDLEAEPAMQDSRHLSRDLIHPNALGHHEAARLVVEMLAERLGPSGLEIAWPPWA